MSKTFEEKSFILRLSEHMDAVAWSKTNDRYYAWQFALWAYRHAIDDVLEKLKSDEALHLMKGKAGNLRESGPTLMAGSKWAEWLEKTML